MNTEQSVKLYHGITNIREDILEEAQCPPVPRKTRRWVRWVVAAACLCLIVGTAAALTTTEFGTRLIGLFTLGEDSDESGYRLGIGIERVSQKELTGAIQEVPEIIVQQYKDYEPYDSWFPGHWKERFSSSAEAREFVGYAGLKGLDWDLEEKWTTVSVLGDRDGNIQTVGLETCYEDGTIRMQAGSRLYTEYYDGELTAGVHSTNYIEFTESYYTTKNGKQCHIISGISDETGFLFLDGYLVEGGVLYHLHSIASRNVDDKETQELLRQWADQF